MFKKAIFFIKKHIFYTIGVLFLIGIGFFYGYKKYFTPSVPVRYVTAPAQMGTLVVSVAGSGQVAASSQLDVKSAAGGKILSLLVNNGQAVQAGQVLAQLDATDAYKAVRDARLNVESAQLSLGKLVQKADALSLLQAQNAVVSAQNDLEKLKLTQTANFQSDTDAKQKAEDTIIAAYQDVASAMDKVFLDLPGTMTNLNDVLFSTAIADNQASAGGRGQTNSSVLGNSAGAMNSAQMQILQFDAESAYQSARTGYDTNFAHYKNIDTHSALDQVVLDNLMKETITTLKIITEAIKKENNFLNAWVDFRNQQKALVYPEVKQYQTSLAGYLTQTSSHLSTLANLQSTLLDNKNAVSSMSRELIRLAQNNPRDLAAAEASVAEKQATLVKLQAGPNVYDKQAAELSLRQRQAALADAEAALANYTVKANIPGMVTNITLHVGDVVGNQTAIATIITTQKIATISLNEVDVAKVKVGQKVTLTFDAVEDLSLTGAVAEIDSLGTVAQGVVSYAVKIRFDSQDERIKPGMSVSAGIISNVEQDVLLVPNAAVKSNAAGNYVQVLVNNVPQNRVVEVGLSNESDTQIISGDLKPGDNVVTQTIAPTASTASANSASGLNLGALTGGGGNRAGGFGGASGRPAVGR